MITVNVELAADPSAGARRRCYRVTVLDGYREPLGRVVVELLLAEGSGGFDVRDEGCVRIEVSTDEAGEAYFDWYQPGGVEAAEARGQLRMTCVDERAADVVLEPQIEMPWI